MKLKHTLSLTLFFGAALLARGLHAPVESPPVQEPLSGPSETPVPSDTAEPTEEPTEEPAGPYTEAWLAELPPETILLQQDYEPTFFRPEAFYPFGRFPVFTLYADGTLVYVNAGENVDQQRIEIVRLSPEEVIFHLQDVMALGFDELQTYTDTCDQIEGEDEKVCIADASFTIFRGVVPSGEFREIKIYASFGNDPALLNAVMGFFTSYLHPDAAVYDPTHATVFARQLTYDLEVPVWQWPLDIELLMNLEPHEYDLDAFILQGDDLDVFYAEFPVKINSYFFDVEGKTVEAYIVPWLPYANHTSAIEETFP